LDIGYKNYLHIFHILELLHLKNYCFGLEMGKFIVHNLILMVILYL
jgi:hypothetical protein